MITAIEIENFKCFGDRVRIDFAPITLLFGPNSAGKTTVFEALLFLHEVFTNGDLDVGTTAKGGRGIDLGGFGKFVRLRDLQRPVSIRLEVLPEHGIPTPLSMFWDEEMDPWHIIGDGGPVGVEITIQWSEECRRPIVTSYTVDIDRIWIARMTTSLDDDSRISDINWIHPRFLPKEKYLVEHLDMVNKVRSLKGEPPVEFRAIKRDPPFPSHVQSVHSYRMKGLFVEGEPIAHDCEDAIQISDFASDFVETHPAGCSPLVLDDDLGCMNGLPLTLGFVEQLFGSSDEHKGVWLTLTHIFWGSGEMIRRELADLLYLGPLRDIPDRGFRPSRRRDESRWPTGLAAWDRLYQTGVCRETDEWLSNPQKLDTGYNVKMEKYRKLKSNSQAMVTLNTGGMLDDPGQVQDEIVNLREFDEIVLVEKATGLETQPNEVGTGISQVLPVVVAAVQKYGIRCIEQPELHIHPRLQVNLGDLFISALTGEPDFHRLHPFDPMRNPSHDKGQFILETHSEHLLLRILRRIREGALSAGNVSVLYIQPHGETGSEILRLRLAEDGEFIDEWPHGFFEDGFNEVFAGR